MAVHFRHCFHYDHVTQLARDDAGWETTPVAIGQTKFKGSFEVLGNNSVHAAIAKIRGNYIVHTVPPPNTIQISINLPTQNHSISWMGHELKNPSLTLSKSDTVYHGLIEGELNAIIIEVPLDNPQSPNFNLVNQMKNIGDLIIAEIDEECLGNLLKFLNFWKTSIVKKDVNSIAGSTYNQISDEMKKILNSIIPKTAIYHSEIEHMELINESLFFIQSNIGNSELSVAKIAEHCGISARYLQIIFKKIFTINPLYYIKCRRFTNIMKLLSNHKYDTSIREAAELNGITHLGRFAAEFKILTGFSPSEWKRLKHQPTQVHADELVV